MMQRLPPSLARREVNFLTAAYTRNVGRLRLEHMRPTNPPPDCSRVPANMVRQPKADRRRTPKRQEIWWLRMPTSLQGL